MEYSHSDAELIEQPIGYWAWAAYKAVVTRTRGALAEKGTTQPQWWVLAQVARAERIKTRAEVSDILSGYLGTGDVVLAEEIDATIAHGWITEDAGGGSRSRRRARTSSTKSLCSRGSCGSSGTRASRKRSISPPSRCCSASSTTRTATPGTTDGGRAERPQDTPPMT